MRLGAVNGFAPPAGVFPYAAATLAVLAALAVQLFADDFLRGFDAYYYAVQADSLVRTGRLRIPDSGLVHYAIAALHFCGLSAENAVRAWTVCSLALFYGVLGLLLRTCRSRNAALLLFAWALASPTIVFIALEFPKQFSFLVVFAAWFFCFHGRKTRWAALAPLMVAGFFLHKSALVYAGIVVVARFLPALGGKITLPRRRVLVPVVGASALLLLWFFVAADVPRFADGLRLKTAVFTPGIIALLREPNLPLAVALECAVAVLLFLHSAFSRRAGKPGLLLSALLMLSICMPAFGAESFNFGERFAVLCPVLALLGCFLLRKDAEPARRPARAAVVLLIAAAAVCGGLRPYMLYPPGHDDALRGYARMTREIAPKAIPMLIVHRGMHFYYKYSTGRDAFSYEPEPHWNKARVWRLAWGLTDDEWQAHLPVECGWSSRYIAKMPVPGYVLIREDCWGALRDSVSREYNPELHDLLWRNAVNPSEPRPAFLYQKHAGEKGEDDGEFSALPREKGKKSRGGE